MTDTDPHSAVPARRYALVLKTHVWDDFIKRQLERYLSAVGPNGDVFVCIDQTNGAVPSIDHDRVLRFTNADLVGLGLANRAERGSLIWWNTDYPHYLFFQAFPNYDYYAFCEYDTVINRACDDLMDDIATAGADFVALPTRTPKMEWMWTRYHLGTYDFEDLTGSLNCIAIFSQRAMETLQRRRIEMSQHSADGHVPFWPLNEVFLATEVKRAGLRAASLDQFGDASGFEWYPPYVEDDLDAYRHLTFLHPVLDKPRYMASLLKFSPLLSFFSGRGRLGLALRRFPEFKGEVPNAFIRRAITRSRERYQGMALRIMLALRPSSAGSNVRGIGPGRGSR
ncbi:MAG: hypothetical protein H7Z10_01495 [Gemmatimonadaceae bacterium]|nr:hypothetical protein [Acetobacteraceae bacterium]